VRHAVAGWAAAWTSGSPVGVLGPATEVLGDAVVVVPVAGLDDLAASVMDATAHLGEPPESRPFVGHMTLCRFKGGRFKEELPSGLVGRPVVASFPVGEVVLFHSRTLDAGPGTSGVVYEVLDRFPLG
jgi:2'-5' RNA ligase